MSKKDDTNNKIKQINIRVSDSEKKIILESGYKPRQILDMFFDRYTNTTPVGLAIKLDSLEKEKDELLDKQIALDTKINDIKKQLSNYDDLDLIPDTIIKLIEVVISKYLNKKFQYHNISEFLEDNSNKDLIDVQSNKIGYNVKDYKKLVIDYYNKHYD